MKKLRHTSPLKSIFDNEIEGAMSSAVLIPEEAQRDLLRSAFSSLKAFWKVAKHKDDEEMLSAVKHLQCVLRNAESLTNSIAVHELFETLFPLRMWLFVIPRGCFRLLNPDPMILLFMAHYETVRLVSELAMPAAHIPFNHEARAASIDNIGHELYEFNNSAFGGNEEYRQLCFKAMKGPLACSTEYHRLRALNTRGLPGIGLIPLPTAMET